MIREGINEDQGWVATGELQGKKYRRSILCKPSEETRYFSITSVYMEAPVGDSSSENSGEDGEKELEVLSGQYHQHPYGEINCVVQLDETAELMGA